MKDITMKKRRACDDASSVRLNRVACFEYLF